MKNRIEIVRSASDDRKCNRVNGSAKLDLVVCFAFNIFDDDDSPFFVVCYYSFEYFNIRAD